MHYCTIQCSQKTTHTEKIRNTTRGCRLWEVKNSGCENSSPTEVKRTFIHQNLSIFITKSMRNFCQTKNSPQNQHHLHPSLGTFLIKFMFSSFSICWNHFTSLAYEIFYARKVDLFDKIKEVVFSEVFSQLFPCVHNRNFEPIYLLSLSLSFCNLGARNRFAYSEFQNSSSLKYPP
jgi:hypothetical protein